MARPVHSHSAVFFVFRGKDASFLQVWGGHLTGGFYGPLQGKIRKCFLYTSLLRFFLPKIFSMPKVPCFGVACLEFHFFTRLLVYSNLVQRNLLNATLSGNSLGCSCGFANKNLVVQVLMLWGFIEGQKLYPLFAFLLSLIRTSLCIFKYALLYLYKLLSF